MAQLPKPVMEALDRFHGRQAARVGKLSKSSIVGQAKFFYGALREPYFFKRYGNDVNLLMIEARSGVSPYEIRARMKEEEELERRAKESLQMRRAKRASLLPRVLR